MKVAIFSAHQFERPSFLSVNQHFGLDLHFFEVGLSAETLALAQGFEVISIFVCDRLDATLLERLKKMGVKLIALRSAGFNHIDLRTAERIGLKVVRVPEYSPYAVAEHALCLILALNRKIHRAFSRVREANFSLDGLVGFDLANKTIGIIGAGRIGGVLAKMMAGIGMNVLAHDLCPNLELTECYGVRYVSFEDLLEQSHIISLHLPLRAETHHLINHAAIARMKKSVMLINTGRGGLIDTRALIEGLKSGQVGHAGLDVYEEEEGLFFQDHSDHILQDDVLARLLTFPNVIVTAHQAFLTQEALDNIASTTLQNISAFKAGRPFLPETSLENTLL